MTYYIIEYLDKDGSKIRKLESVENLDDTVLYIKEHHLMTRRIYKVWFPKLKWKSKVKPVLEEVKIDKESDTFVSKDGNTKVVPAKHFIVDYWYSEPFCQDLNINGYERYNVYKIDREE